MGSEMCIRDRSGGQDDLTLADTASLAHAGGAVRATAASWVCDRAGGGGSWFVVGDSRGRLHVAEVAG